MSAAEPERSPLVDLQRRLNNVIPDDQELLSISAETSARDALKLMAEHRFSQLPVVEADRVLGMFSYRSFARESVRAARSTSDLLDLPVEECLEQPDFGRLDDDFQNWLRVLQDKDAILVGERDRLEAIVTSTDVMEYLYRVANPFMLLFDIELTLRELIRVAVTPAELAQCATLSLARRYEASAIPTELEMMSFGDYEDIVCDGRHWGQFEAVFGASRARAKTKIREAREIRNQLFHLREELSAEQFTQLTDLREWFFTKARRASTAFRSSSE